MGARACSCGNDGPDTASLRTAVCGCEVCVACSSSVSSGDHDSRLDPDADDIDAHSEVDADDRIFRFEEELLSIEDDGVRDAPGELSDLFLLDGFVDTTD